MERIEKLLAERRQNNLLRTLIPACSRKGGRVFFKDKEYIDFSSNDYLGLSDHPQLKEASKKGADSLGTGACASRLLSGDLNIHHQLEKKIAEFKEKESALIFNSGYQANLGILSALYTRGDVIFSDRLNHASIVDGMRLCQAKIFRFIHNDPGHLENLLKSQRHKFKNALIITETIFSMDGDKPPLAEIVDLKEKYHCKLMVDEAHATGIFGEAGAGMVQEENLAENIELIMGTFSKALAGFGAYLACSVKIKEYLVNFSRSFIYSTALPAPVIAANLASLDLIEQEPFRRKILLANAGYFRRKLRQYKFKVKGESQIVPLIVGDSKKAANLSEQLKKRGYWVLPIRPPTVPQGEARLRFSLSYHHSQDILERLSNELYQISHV